MSVLCVQKSRHVALPSTQYLHASKFMKTVLFQLWQNFPLNIKCRCSIFSFVFFKSHDEIFVMSQQTLFWRHVWRHNKAVNATYPKRDLILFFLKKKQNVQALFLILFSSRARTTYLWCHNKRHSDVNCDVIIKLQRHISKTRSYSKDSTRHKIFFEFLSSEQEIGEYLKINIEVRIPRFIDLFHDISCIHLYKIKSNNME